MQCMFALALILSADPGATSPSHPTVDGWMVVSGKQRQLELRADDYRKALVGLVVQYQNPQDSSDRVLVFYRHIALLSERPRENQLSQDSARPVIVVGAGIAYHVKNEQDALDRAEKSMDPFAYVHYHVEIDPHNGQEMLVGSAESWLLDGGGLWAYDSRASLGAIKEAPLSEPIKVLVKKGQVPRCNPKHPIIVGFTFKLGGASHVVRVDQDDLVVVVTKEKSHAK